jgi:hypothetical protein
MLTFVRQMNGEFLALQINDLVLMRKNTNNSPSCVERNGAATDKVTRNVRDDFPRK